MISDRTYHSVRASVSLLDILSLLQRLLPDDLHPVAIRVKHKSNVLHPPISELLLEPVASIFKALASCLKVVNRDAKMAEALVRLCVAIGDLVVRVVFRAVVVCELDDALTICPMVAVRNRLWAIVCEEVEVKLGVRVRQLINELHAQELIEFQTTLGILDAKPTDWVSACLESQWLMQVTANSHGGTHIEWLSL